MFSRQFRIKWCSYICLELVAPVILTVMSCIREEPICLPMIAVKPVKTRQVVRFLPFSPNNVPRACCYGNAAPFTHIHPCAHTHSMKRDEHRYWLPLNIQVDQRHPPILLRFRPLVYPSHRHLYVRIESKHVPAFHMLILLTIPSMYMRI